MARVSTRDRNKNKFYKDGRPKPPNWEYRFPIAPVDGKRQHASQAGFKSQKEAEEAGTQAMAEYLGTGDAFKPEKISYSDVLDLWIENHVLLKLKDLTISKYLTIINTHIRPALGSFFITRIRPLDIQTFLNSFVTKGYATGYIRNVHTILKATFKYAIEPCLYIKQNPMLYVTMPKGVAAKEKEIISREDFQTILTRFPEGDKFYIALMISYHTGLRLGEVLGLTWENIDFEQRTLTVEKQKQLIDFEGARVCVLSGLKSKASYRTIPLGATILEELRKEKLRQSQNKLRYGRYFYKYSKREIKKDVYEIVEDRSGAIEFVCRKESGELMTHTSIKYLKRVVNKQLDIPFEFHALRHTHATILVESGANVKGVQQRLGHEHVKTTLQYYAKTTELITQNTVELFEQALK